MKSRSAIAGALALLALSPFAEARQTLDTKASIVCVSSLRSQVVDRGSASFNFVSGSPTFVGKYAGDLGNYIRPSANKRVNVEIADLEDSTFRYTDHGQWTEQEFIPQASGSEAVMGLLVSTTEASGDVTTHVYATTKIDLRQNQTFTMQHEDVSSVCDVLVFK